MSKSLSRLESFALRVAEAVLDHPRFAGLLREMVLRVHVTREEQERQTAVQAFLRACGARGIRVWVGDDGRLKATHQERFGADLRAVLVVHRPAVYAHLLRERDAARLAERRLREERERQGKVDAEALREEQRLFEAEQRVRRSEQPDTLPFPKKGAS